ncbi:MAG: hypothetical protein JJT76_09850 [Clostridiaceae bacterium]|nr:hypothetical protein [Clostridiaceae bacterium]
MGNKDNFDSEILKDLMAQGYDGDELLNKFKEMRGKVRPAIQKLIDEADEITKSTKGIETEEVSKLFSEDD